MHHESEDSDAITAWFRRNSFPLEHIEAGNGFADLQPLKEILKDVRVVGLGEATHGTREFFQVKHRLLEFLVLEMAFTTFVIEGSYAASQAINEYVLHGVGDRAAVLTGLGYVPWDTEEFSAMLDWMRVYNQGVSDERKVRFLGADLWRNEIGRTAVLAYLRSVAPDRVPATEALFDTLAGEEPKWPQRIDDECKAALREAQPRLQELLNHLSANRDEYVRASSPEELDEVVQYVRVMQQWTLANTSEDDTRSGYMGENAIYLTDRGGADAKYVFWAHNGHLQKGAGQNIGRSLRAKHGPDYYAFCLEFYQGSFQTRMPLSGTILGDLKAITLSPAPEGSVPWHLARAATGDLILDLRVAAGSPEVEQWLQTPQIVHVAHWVCPDGFQYYPEASLAQVYDGIVFVNRTTPTRPTPNALGTVAARDAL